MNRRLLLINPAHVVDGRRRAGPAQFPIPPLNLGYVAALTPANWDVRIVDENLGMDEVTGWAPDLVGITTLTPTAPRAYALAGRYRRAGAHVVLGGVHVSALPDEATRYADSVVVGEAEPIWAQLIADVEAGHPRRRYQGDLLPLDGLPVPRRDLLPRRYFVETIITSKGCTNTCGFCAIWRFYGRRYRSRPVDEVADELATLPPHKLVFFADDNLTAERDRVIALCQRMVETGNRRPYAIQGTIGLGEDEELLTWLKRSGCLFVFVGLESISDEVLTRIGKRDLLRTGAAGHKARIARIHAHGIAVFGSVILGLDGDNTSFEQMQRFILDAEIDCALVNILNPVPGTQLWDRMCKQGRLLYTSFPADYALYTQDNVLPPGGDGTD